MIMTRAYVPSQTLLCALARPQTTQCLRAFTTTARMRNERHRAARPVERSLADLNPSELTKVFQEAARLEDGPSTPLSDQELQKSIKEGQLPIIHWYDVDEDTGGPPRLIESVVTTEDWKREGELYRMTVESTKDPNYDSAQLDKSLIDVLLRDPDFADLAEDLIAMKQDIKTKKELEALDKEGAKEAEAETQEFSASLRLEMHKSIQQLISDPQFAEAKPELQEILDKMPELDDFGSEEFQGLLDQAMAKISSNPAMDKKLNAIIAEAEGKVSEDEWTTFEKDIQDVIKEDDESESAIALEDLGDVDKLMLQMRDIMKSIDNDKTLQRELEAATESGTESPQTADPGLDLDPEELAKELTELSKLSTATKSPGTQSAASKEDVSAELEAKVDKIMQDPRLMEKLVYLQKLIAQRRNANPSTVPYETAPDPYELDEEHTTTLKHRMQIAKADPEHAAALDRLRVHLRPPFGISPSVKLFNQAIEYAYIGANDDIRRVLWRTYQKARMIPTFLQNLSDEAWDIMYYSQAVTWNSNQNRESHLRILLADLKRLGRDGPPTHPSNL